MATSSTKVPTGGLSLTSHDINVLSSLVQQKSLPRDYLLEVARSSGISSSAMKIAMLIIDPPQKSVGVKLSEERRAVVDLLDWLEQISKSST